MFLLTNRLNTVRQQSGLTALSLKIYQKKFSLQPSSVDKTFIEHLMLQFWCNVQLGSTVISQYISHIEEWTCQGPREVALR